MDLRSSSTSRVLRQKPLPLAAYRLTRKSEKSISKTSRNQSDYSLSEQLKSFDDRKNQTARFSNNVKTEPSEVFVGASNDMSPGYKNLLSEIKYKHESVVWLKKHRELILEILKVPNVLASLNGFIISKLKELTVTADSLTSLINTLNESHIGNSYDDAILQVMSRQLYLKDEEIAGLRSASEKLREENKELANMLVSIETQNKLSNDLTKYLSNPNFSPKIKQREIKSPTEKPKLLKFHRTLEELVEMATKATNYDSGLKLLSEESKKYIDADGVFLFNINPQRTKFYTYSNGVKCEMAVKNTILSLISHNQRTKSAIEGQPEFDARIEPTIGMRVRSFQAGMIVDESDKNLGILLAVRKTAEISHEREFSNLLLLFSMFISKWQAKNELGKEKTSLITTLSSCSELIKQVAITDFIQVLEENLPKMMHTSRATVLLCDNNNRKLYRKASNRLLRAADIFPSQRGIAGYTANVKMPVICNDVISDKRFVKEIDDPCGTFPQNILAVPLNGKETEGLPKAVIEIIDKTDGTSFTEYEADIMMEYSKLIANMMENLLLQESFSNINSVFKNLEHSLGDLSCQVEGRPGTFVAVKKNLEIFKTLFKIRY
ncbi:unnamed protein product [Blepharisma stoltei]|uniref:GAF domain-containing protein n=1 Tax=Blepharisma stoltei TaxID=1481888 RepID=A0AAU9K731_9CILI|nr:unnamed protein product [Blepharisma stoltei]